MSAQPVEQERQDQHRGSGTGPGNEATAAGLPVEVRRNALVSGVIGAAASAIATAYLWRAVGSGGLLDWVLCAVLAIMAVGYLRSLLDSRTPLVVADEMGIRVRLGADWRGVPWEAVDRVVVTPRRGVLRDGRLVVTLHHVQRATEGLEGRALRHARLNRRLYGAALAVPLGLTTRVTGDGDVGDRVAALSHGRTEVVSLLDTPGQVVRPEPEVPPEEPLPGSGETGERRARRTVPFRVVDITRPVTAGVDAADAEAADADSAQDAAGFDATRPAPTGATSRDRRVRRIAELREPVDPVVIEEFEPQPAYDPVIGPELAAARTRVGLSVDELAERTRIRPHVIESIEVDDFMPCGGDFYARGHIRTLARMLGKDPVPMLEHFEKRYASAPVSAKKVFEAELATGMTGTVRGGGLGGPNWPLLVGAVLALVLVWSAVRLFAGAGDEVLETPPPVLAGSAELASGFGAVTAAPQQRPLTATVTAVNAGTSVEVRDGDGELVFQGDLVIGATKRVRGLPPLTVSADNGGALAVEVRGRDMGTLGAPDEPATKVFQAPTD